jgi:hypothetical protein
MDFRDDTEPADLLNSRHRVEEISDPACRLLNRPPGYLTFCLYAWPVVFLGTWLRYFAQEDVVSHDTAIVSFLSFANKPFCNSSSPSCSPLWFKIQSHYILSPRTRCGPHLRCQISSLSVVLIPCPMFHPDKAATTPSNNQHPSRPSPSKQGALHISSSQNQKPIPSIPKLFCNITAHQRFLAKS